MIVLDASALLELVLATPAGEAVAAEVATGVGLHVPHLADLEVVQGLRRLSAAGVIDAPEAAAAFAAYRKLDFARHAHEPFLDRIWELRENLTAYDAAYAALSEVLGATLVTCDGKLARASGVRCRRVLIAAGRRPRTGI